MTPARRAGAGASAEKERQARVVHGIARAHPDARIALVFSDPLQLLIATVLSAQCTDERVNMVTRDLFKRYRAAGDYASAPREKLEQEIKSTGFFRSKAKAIQGLCAALLERHDGKVPETMEELVALPGVGRKTANVVLGEAFGVASGIVVDTHVHRLSRRLGLTRHDDPVKIERDLMEIVPRPQWIPFGMRMITHGRRVCGARKPLCGECALLEDCPFGQRQGPAPPSKGRARGRSSRRAAPVAGQTRGRSDRRTAGKAR